MSRAGVAAALLSALLACGSPPRPPAQTFASPSSPSPPSPPGASVEREEPPEREEPQAPAAQEGGVIELEIEGFEPAVLVVPQGSDPRPLLVATHGAGDRAEWTCALWGRLAAERAYVLCPRGKRIRTRSPDPSSLYFYPTHLFIEREIDAALSAMRARFGERVDLERAAYAGFSQGAIMGALVLARRPARFPRAVLIEGAYGFGQWDTRMSQMFHRGGGERVAMVCGGWFCGQQARASSLSIERAGAKARVWVASGGHTYGGEVAVAAGRALDWAIEGDERWRER